MRVFIGPHEVCGQIHQMATALRLAGADVTTGVWQKNRFYTHLPYDLELQPRLLLDAHGQAVSLETMLGRLVEFVQEFDVFMFFFGQSFLPENADFPLLQDLGKRIVSRFNGSDVRHWSAHNQFFFRQHFAYGWDDLLAPDAKRPLEAHLHPLRMGERYASVIQSAPEAMALAVRPYHHAYNIIPTDHTFTPRIPRNRRPLVLHAASNSLFKGTSAVKAAFETLSARGIPFEWGIVQDIPNRDLLQLLPQVDVVVDDLHSTIYGSFAIEAMASGCAVVSGARPDFAPIPANAPIWHAHPDTLADRLEALLTDPAEIARRAEAGLSFVARHHAAPVVGAHVLAQLAPPPPPADYRPSFCARAYVPPAGDSVSAEVQALTRDVVLQHGLPEGVDPASLVARGLMQPLPADARVVRFSASHPVL